jgi:hypothetical protein
MQSKLLMKIISFIAISVGLTTGALYLNSAVYHLWLADGPPVNDPIFHLNLFYKHAFISFVGFTAAIVVFVIFWRKRKNGKAN